MLDSEFLDGSQRERVRARLQRFLDAEVQSTLAPMFTAALRARGDAALRGHLHRLNEGLGVAPGATEADIPPHLRGQLKALGVRAGRFALFIPPLLKPRAAGLRASLWALKHGVSPPELPAPGLVSLSQPETWPQGFASAIGWVEAGPVLVRLDIAERLAAELAWASRLRPAAVPADLASRLSIRAELLPPVLRAMGFRIVPAASLDAEGYGPPAPPMLMQIRRKRPAAQRPAPVRKQLPTAGNAFSALAALRL